ncbi:MAG: hypothetical protein WEB88_02155 [Gemmatimonadota bacterium]
MDNILLFPLYVLVVVAAGFGSVLLARWLHQRQRGPAPTAEPTPQREGSASARRDALRARWRGIDRDQLHEINRAEVDRLLARVDADGAASLKVDERRFLDYLAELTGGSESPSGERDAGAGSKDGRAGKDGGAAGTRTVADPQSGEA